ncbi:MAG: DNA repair protein RecN [Chloroflexota bacterium]|nr:DNA repair protein RecN [Chloroflexota bacterium]MDE2920472.1 DNA repair protein RecN [Chloroflexota bacterium]
MLRHVSVRDFALIDAVDLALEPGLNVLTGETGAGKSILIDAMALVLGRRAHPADIRPDARHAYVEAVFDATPGRAVAVLDSHGVEVDESLTLSREVRGAGRSTARINGRAVPVRALAELGRTLVDMHGPSEHQSLFRRSQQLEYLDRFAGLIPEREAMAALVRDLRATSREADLLQRNARETAREIDLLTFQVDEIAAAGLTAGEDERLRADRLVLANAERLRGLASQAAAQLQGETLDPAPDIFGSTRAAAEEMASLDRGVRPLAEQAAQLQELAADLALTFQSYAENVEADPARLEQIDERLNQIESLTRKYGDTPADVVAYGESARERLDELDRGDARIEALREHAARLRDRLIPAVTALSAARVRAARELADAIAVQLADLNMASAEFEVSLRRQADADGLPVEGEPGPVAFDESGIDHVDFLLSVNVGQPRRPLADVASEGERSRILLGLKVVLAGADETPTLVFDEIDVGVGPRAGDIVGQKLAALAEWRQVLCITHLAPVAAFGDAHFVVAKSDAHGLTTTDVSRVDGQRVVEEIAAMSGATTTAGRRVARDLMAAAQSWKDDG